MTTPPAVADDDPNTPPDAGLTFWQKEPAVIIAAVTAIAGVAVSLGYISDEQQRAIIAAISAILSLAVGFFTRKVVTPTAKAKVIIAKANRAGYDAASGDVADAKANALYHSSRADTAETALAMLADIHRTVVPVGPAPEAMLHPLAEDPPIPGVTA